jgi:hypothetical protein
VNSLNSFKRQIFEQRDKSFDQRALSLFRFQADSNPVYREYLQLLGLRPHRVDSVEKIPFLPIEFFRTHDVVSAAFEAEEIFQSSGTTDHLPSRHIIEDLEFYKKNTQNIFESFYGPVSDYHVLGLLPSYLERERASLVAMARHFIEQSHSPLSGFFLHDFEALLETIDTARKTDKKILIIGVTFALMEFADAHPVPLPDAIVIETGGMKGRRPEITREEVHNYLRSRLSAAKIHSEYGMTELHSQAYLTNDSWFQTPWWMKIMIRDIHDPMAGMDPARSGGINVIDLANVCSCAFIETADIGVSNGNGGFRVLGRLDNSDVRGCNLMLHY